MPDFTTSEAHHLPQILQLQRANLESAVEGHPDGFVTVRHTLDLLTDMHRVAPHIVAVHGGEVIGYALSMAPEFADRIPVLAPMFEEFSRTDVNGSPLADVPYLVMGQVCVAAQWRGRGVFSGLYRTQKETYVGRYDWLVTEISARNLRSVAAHAKVGFKTIRTYSASGETWRIVALSLVD